MCNGCKMLTFLPLATPTCHTYAMAHFPTLGHACCVYAIVHLPALGHAHLLHLHHGTSSCWLCPPAMPAPLSYPWLYLPALALLSHLCLPAFMHLPHLCTCISATPSCHAPHQLLYSEEPTICWSTADKLVVAFSLCYHNWSVRHIEIILKYCNEHAMTSFIKQYITIISSYYSLYI